MPKFFPNLLLSKETLFRTAVRTEDSKTISKFLLKDPLFFFELMIKEFTAGNTTLLEPLLKTKALNPNTTFTHNNSFFKWDNHGKLIKQVGGEHAHTYTLLGLAISLSKPNIVNLLIDYGADVNQKSLAVGYRNFPESPLILAIEYDQKEIAATLIRHDANIHCNQHSSDPFRRPPRLSILFALEKEAYDIAYQLIKAGALTNSYFIKVNRIYFYTEPPIEVSGKLSRLIVKSGRFELCELVLNEKILYSHYNNSRSQVLQSMIREAAGFNDYALIEQLILYSVSTNMQRALNYNQQNSPLNEAISLKNDDMVRLLIKYNFPYDASQRVQVGQRFISAKDFVEKALSAPPSYFESTTLFNPNLKEMNFGLPISCSRL